MYQKQVENKLVFFPIFWFSMMCSLRAEVVVFWEGFFIPATGSWLALPKLLFRLSGAGVFCFASHMRCIHLVGCLSEHVGAMCSTCFFSPCSLAQNEKMREGSAEYIGTFSIIQLKRGYDYLQKLGFSSDKILENSPSCHLWSPGGTIFFEEES